MCDVRSSLSRKLERLRRSTEETWQSTDCTQDFIYDSHVLDFLTCKCILDCQKGQESEQSFCHFFRTVEANCWSSQTTPSSVSDTSLAAANLSVEEVYKLKLSLFFFWVTWLAFKSTTGRGNGCSNWQFMYIIINGRLTRWSSIREVK